jgi:hypothetical protein
MGIDSRVTTLTSKIKVVNFGLMGGLEETLVTTYKTARRHKPENDIQHTHAVTSKP